MGIMTTHFAPEDSAESLVLAIEAEAHLGTAGRGLGWGDVG
jgi:hypothetical protein